MSGFLLRIFIGIALAFAAHAQPKPPPDKAPTNDTKPPAAPVSEGQRLDNAIALCIGCHGIPGYKTAFPVVYHVPKIAGQQPGYIINALKAYKSGERSHPSMRGIAATLTDEDMKKLAEHYGAREMRLLALLVGLRARRGGERGRQCRVGQGEGRAGLRRVPWS